MAGMLTVDSGSSSSGHHRRCALVRSRGDVGSSTAIWHSQCSIGGSGRHRRRYNAAEVRDRASTGNGGRHVANGSDLHGGRVCGRSSGDERPRWSYKSRGTVYDRNCLKAVGIPARVAIAYCPMPGSQNQPEPPR